MTITKTRDKLEKTRTRTSLLFLILNTLLFVSKILLGLITSSMSLIADAINNLNDALTSLIAFFSNKFSNKAPDNEHPFGHRRIEYIGSTILAIILLFSSFEVIKSAIQTIYSHQRATISFEIFIVLMLSIAIKSFFFIRSQMIYKKTNSLIFKAILNDSLMDIIINMLMLITLILAKFSKLPLDAFLAVLLVIIIAWQAVQILKESFDEIIGKSPPKELIQAIDRLYDSSSMILEHHDLVLNNYGSGRTIGSIHVEVDASLGLIEVHEEVERLEVEALEKYGVLLSTHVDPRPLDDQELNEARKIIQDICKAYEPAPYPHDFHLYRYDGKEVLKIEILFPESLQTSADQIMQEISYTLSEELPKINLQIRPEFGHFPRD
ncbi:MAG: cation diffusion facilitator family transporter [Eubacteriales bacterium]|nr:cation diffusion facilitator family transporter [Eubacteriales bacterium]